MKQYKLIVKGVVQGVCFRAETKQLASNLQIKGYVKNLSDGSVEISLQCEKKALETLLESLKNLPAPIKITFLDISEETFNQSFQDFEIRY